MSRPEMRKVQILDTHTGGEPTRIIVAGGPELGRGSMAERRAVFGQRFSDFRSAVINEPRGSDVLVGALLCEPADPSCCAGVIFFNNVGPLWMCGHGTIGVGVALGYLGRIKSGRYKLETPVGVVEIEYDGDNTVSLENVPAYRYRAGVTVEVPGVGPITGDVAWGGNWFFLIAEHGQALELDRVDELTAFAWKVRQALERAGITGAEGGLIDHIELFGPPSRPDADCRSFVLCPGKAYDRSPCGTGTSAKLACLVADGKLKPGAVWRQESIVGSLFSGTVRLAGESIIPRITGTAYVTGEGTLLLDPRDPFCLGIRP
jgi:4-hydroxyproline epimerase